MARDILKLSKYYICCYIFFYYVKVYLVQNACLFVFLYLFLSFFLADFQDLRSVLKLGTCQEEKEKKNLYTKAKKNLSKEKWKYFVDFTFKMIENYLVELRLVRHSIMVQKQFRGPSQMFLKIGVLKNFTNLTGKQLCWSLFLIKSQAWSPAILLIETPTEMFSSVYCEIFKSSFFIEQSLWLLLDIFCKCSKV